MTILSFYVLLGIFFACLSFRWFSITYFILICMIFYIIVAPFLIIFFDQIIDDPTQGRVQKGNKS